MSPELQRVKGWRDDYACYAREALTVRTKRGLLSRLKMNPAQRRIHEVVEEQRKRLGRVRVAVLKARQQGSSTYFAGRLFWLANLWKEGVQSMAFSLSDEATVRLANMVRLFHSSLPEGARWPLERFNDHEIGFGKSNLQFWTGGRSAGDRGRGSTLGVAWLSEVQFLESAQELLSALVPAVPKEPGTEMWCESTARGGPTGPWYNFWVSAKAGEHDFTTVFLPWYLSDEYREEVPTGFSLSNERPAGGSFPSEVEYAAQHGLDDSQMLYRRKQIEGMSLMGGNGALAFSWEYPATEEEAFVGGTSDSFIGAAEVERARLRQLVHVDYRSLASVWGLDVAPPHGEAATALVKRRGPDCYSIERVRGLRLEEQVQWIVRQMEAEGPAMVNVDASESYGQVLAERIRTYGAVGQVVRSIQFGGRPDAPERFANKRAEMWYRGAQWLLGDVSIPNEQPVAGQPSLASEILSPRLKSTELKVQLESKQQMFARGVVSLDGADAWALTFAQAIDPGPEMNIRPHTAPVAPGLMGDTMSGVVTAPMRM